MSGTVQLKFKKFSKVTMQEKSNFPLRKNSKNLRLSYWLLSMDGELGELCKLKKFRYILANFRILKKHNQV